MTNPFARRRYGPLIRARAIATAVGVSVIVGVTPALAVQQFYTYSVTHPSYGNIGTLTQTIDRSPEATRIDSRLRISVEQSGIVLYRQECDATEIMSGSRLVSLQSVTELNGRHLEVHGEAQGDQFVVNTTAGLFMRPANTTPSDPWVLKHTGELTVVHPSTGRLGNVHISGGDYEMISVNGAYVSARYFAIIGDNREDVWLDNRGIPVMFRTVEDGTPIDFVLQNERAATGALAVASIKRPPQARVWNSAK
jgi:hypothetical protein